jgi:hypothetical protein
MKLAGETLATRTKNLPLGAWLTEGLLHQERLSGLRQGFDLLGGDAAPPRLGWTSWAKTQPLWRMRMIQFSRFEIAAGKKRSHERQS